jgi:hypothetical protein
VNCLGESAGDLPSKTEQNRKPSKFGQPLGAASRAVFCPGHCQVGPLVDTCWLAISLGGFLLFVGP